MQLSTEPREFSPEQFEQVHSLMQGYVDQEKIPGIITTVAQRGQLIHFACFGWSDQEANQPMQLDTIMRLYSMTKPITSVAVLMLYEEGHFQLDDPVARFLPALAGMKVCRTATTSGLQLVEPDRAMTIRDLLLHTSGLPSPASEGSPVEQLYHQADPSRSDRTLAEMVQILGELPLMDQPGSTWRYGMSLDVLGHLIEVVADMPLDAFLEQRIFAPLGMQDTGFSVPPEKHALLAAVYGPAAGGELARMDTPEINQYTQPCKFLSGASGLVSTAPDYLRFAQMLLNGGELDGERILDPKTVAAMTTNQLPARCLPYRLGPPELDHLTLGHGFGFGVRILSDPAQASYPGSVGEYGWGGAANTMMWVDPAHELVCLFLTQFMPPFVFYPVEREFKMAIDQALIE